MGMMMSLLCGLLGCASQKETFKSVTVAEFERVIADPSICLVDVRTAEEYADGHLKGALNIDVKRADFEEQARQQLPKGKTLAVYCRSGGRSKRAASLLTEMGYKVVEQNTGYLGWVEAGKPVVK